MPTRPDLRDIATNVRDAFADSDRDALLDILTFVVKEYVVEGPPPMLMHQAETVAELASLSFAQLITALQTRLDLPELAMFAVDGEQVSVRIGGVMHPLQPGRSAPAAELPRPSAGVRVVETNLTQRPPPPPQVDAPPPPRPAAAASAPPPARGLSVRGRPPGEGAPSPAVPEPAPGSAAAPAPAAGAAPAKSSEEASGDSAAARFSLLELD